ncbi:hypothetical protein HDV05_006352 [Chytridiales sp. JEL 0842]|nr:hypothetical protein HDV05_006352 [Chytridiales sp. JEL 0842]
MMPEWVKGYLNYLPFMKRVEDGALTQIFACTSSKIVEEKLQGKYFVPTAQLSETSPQGKDEGLAEKLWSFTEELLKEKGFGLP